MNKLQKISRALAILANYPYGDFTAEHDEIWAGPADGVEITKCDREELEALGWSDGEGMGWHRYV